MKYPLILLLLALFVIWGSFNANAAYFIVGFVENATDGQDANGFTVMLYRTADGPSNQITDIIGPGGVYNDEGNYYVLDCEALSPACAASDNLTVQVLNNGSNYLAGPVALLRGTEGVDAAPNMELTYNASPSVVINAPGNASVIQNLSVVNATITNLTGFFVDKAIYFIGNSSGNYSKDAALGSSPLIRAGTSHDYNDTFNSSKFADGTYFLYVSANTTKGARNTTRITVQFNNTVPMPDLRIQSTDIVVSNATPLEGQNVTINVTVHNIGTVDANSVGIQFFQGNYSLNIQIGANQTANIAAGSNVNLSQTWLAVLGATDIYVIVDPPIASGGSIAESIETNNYAYQTVTVSPYQKIVGNISGRLALQDALGTTLVNWAVTNTNRSNVFVADSDASINFDSLKPLGRYPGNGSFVANDFAELDVLLNMTNVSQNINSTYMVNGQSRHLTAFIIFGNTLGNVSYVNSSTSANFITGILWDSSDDNDVQFDATDKEDVVFIAKVNPQKQGQYGTYDYEISFPANLRRYSLTSEATVAIYAEIR